MTEQQVNAAHVGNAAAKDLIIKCGFCISPLAMFPLMMTISYLIILVNINCVRLLSAAC